MEGYQVKKRGGFHAQDEGEEIDEMAQKQFLDSHQTEIPAEQVFSKLSLTLSEDGVLS